VPGPRTGAHTVHRPPEATRPGAGALARAHTATAGQTRGALRPGPGPTGPGRAGKGREGPDRAGQGREPGAGSPVRGPPVRQGPVRTALSAGAGEPDRHRQGTGPRPAPPTASPPVPHPRTGPTHRAGAARPHRWCPALASAAAAGARRPVCRAGYGGRPHPGGQEPDGDPRAAAGLRQPGSRDGSPAPAVRTRIPPRGRGSSPRAHEAAGGCPRRPPAVRAHRPLPCPCRPRTPPQHAHRVSAGASARGTRRRPRGCVALRDAAPDTTATATACAGPRGCRPPDGAAARRGAPYVPGGR
jgi:hypothetical protein